MSLTFAMLVKVEARLEYGRGLTRLRSRRGRVRSEWDRLTVLRSYLQARDRRGYA